MTIVVALQCGWQNCLKDEFTIPRDYKVEKHGTTKIVASKDTAQGYKVYCKDGIFYEKILDTVNYQSLTELFLK